MRVRTALQSLASGAALLVPGAAYAQAQPVSDADAAAFASALHNGDTASIRRLVAERVLQLVGTSDFVPSTPEKMAAAARGCRLLRTDRVPNNNAVFLEFACAGRSRTGLAPEEDPGISVKLWPHPSGAGLAVYYVEGGVQARPRTRPPAPPAPPTPPPSRSH